MGFTEAVRTVLTKKYATFSGRASRSECWWFQLFYVLVLIGLGILAALVAGSGGQDEPSSLLIAVGIIAGLFVLAMLLPQMSLTVRRFHDRDISGWWYLAIFIGNLIPYLNVVAGLAGLVITVLRGTEGPNKYGPDPLRPEMRAEVFA